MTGAAARGLPAFLRRAQCLQVDIADAALIEAGGKLVLGKAATARRGDRAHVHQELHARVLQLVQHCLLRRLLIADREEFFRFGH